MKTTLETCSFQDYWMKNFFGVLWSEPALYKQCMISRIRSCGEKPTLEKPENFREFICSWMFIHCFILHEHVLSIENPEMREKVQQMALDEISAVCSRSDSAGGLLVEFLSELETDHQQNKDLAEFSPGAMLAWYYCKRLRQHSPDLTDLPSSVELNLITRLTDDTIRMTLSSFDHLLES